MKMYERLFHKKLKFQRRLTLIIAILLLAVLLSYAVLLYNQSRQQLLSLYTETDLQVLKQLGQTVSLIDNTMINALISAYFDNDVASAIYLTEPDLPVLTRAQNTLRKLLLAPNDFVISVHLYMREIDYIVSAGAELDTETKKNFAKKYAVSAPKLKPLYRESSDGTTSEAHSPYLTYVMYGEPAARQANGIIVARINPEWILSRLNELNTSDSSENDEIFLFYKDQFLGPRDLNGYSLNFAQKILSSIYKSPEDEASSQIATIDGRRYLVSAAMVPGTELWFARSRPYRQVLIVNTRLQIIVLFSTLTAIIISIISSFFAGEIIYRPVRSLVKEARELLPDIDFASTDEITFLRTAYKTSAQALKKLKEREDDKDRIRISHILRKLIFEGTADSIQDSDGESLIHINIEKPVSLFVLRTISSGRRLSETIINKETASTNILLEDNIISDLRDFPVDVVRIGIQNVVILINTDLFFTQKEKILHQIDTIRSSLYTQTGARVAAAMSDGSDTAETLPEIYRFTSEATAYAFQYGYDIIISPDLINPNLVNDSIEFKTESIQNLKRSITEGETEEVLHELDTILVEAKLLQADVVRMALMTVIIQIRMVLQNRYVVLTPEIRENLDRLSHELFQAESLQDFALLLKKTLSGILKTDDLHTASPLVSATYGIIHHNFADPGLYIPEIAERLNVTAKYLGQVFREETGLSIPEYLNDYRMKQASLLLTKNDIKVSDVMIKVGIENESHFYRSFKRLFGMTPRNFVLRHRI